MLPKRSSVRSTQRRAASSSTACAPTAERLLADLRRGGFGRLLLAGGEHHVGAGGRQLLGDRQPDSARGAGDDRGSAGQVQ